MYELLPGAFDEDEDEDEAAGVDGPLEDAQPDAQTVTNAVTAHTQRRITVVEHGRAVAL